MLDAGEQAAEVVAAGDDGGSPGCGRGVHEGPLALRPPSAAMSQPKPSMFWRMSSGGLLEGDEDARLAGLADALDQELDGEHGLGAAGRPRHAGSIAPARQPAVGDQVEARRSPVGSFSMPASCPSPFTALSFLGRCSSHTASRSSPSKTFSRIRQVADDAADRGAAVP